jgi:2-polyprenyl-6-hydroxyphenyl methylase/3-demethylubiquinone-9 3-methyltransferase
MNEIRCLGSTITTGLFPSSTHDFLALFPEAISIDSLFHQLDTAWDNTLAKHNGETSQEFFTEYYEHPVWALNSVFAEHDPTSRKHRQALAATISELGILSIADVGGGYGGFLRILKEINPAVGAFLCEPYLNEETKHSLLRNNITCLPAPPASTEGYVLLDVLEHLPDPLMLTKALVDNAQPGSWFFFGNCFFPVIKCHLPSTFFLRQTFPLAAQLMGLKRVGVVQGAEYIHVYRLEIDQSKDPLVSALNRLLPSLSSLLENLGT